MSENADYDAARDHQARVEARIQELEAMIKNAVIVKDTEGASGELTVKFGATVKILDLSIIRKWNSKLLVRKKLIH